MKSKCTALGLMLMAFNANAVSFDCNKASTPIEKAVCSDPQLGILDDALAQNYKRMLSANIGDGAKSDLRTTQKAWIAARNMCTNIACLTDAYKQRVDAICDYPVISGAHPGCTSSEEAAGEAKAAESAAAPAAKSPQMAVQPSQTSNNSAVMSKLNEKYKHVIGKEYCKLEDDMFCTFLESAYVNINNRKYLGAWTDMSAARRMHNPAFNTVEKLRINNERILKVLKLNPEVSSSAEKIFNLAVDESRGLISIDKNNLDVIHFYRQF